MVWSMKQRSEAKGEGRGSTEDVDEEEEEEETLLDSRGAARFLPLLLWIWGRALLGGDGWACGCKGGVGGSGSGPDGGEAPSAAAAAGPLAVMPCCSSSIGGAAVESAITEPHRRQSIRRAPQQREGVDRTRTRAPKNPLGLTGRCGVPLTKRTRVGMDEAPLASPVACSVPVPTRTPVMWAKGRCACGVVSQRNRFGVGERIHSRPIHRSIVHPAVTEQPAPAGANAYSSFVYG